MANSQLASQSLKRILYLLAFLGFYGTWIRSAINGGLFIIFDALHVTHTLPGGKVPIKTSFTGLYWPIDYLLDVLVVFWWQAVDGSHPSTTIFSLYFAGQHVAVITALYVDSYKLGRRNWRVDPTLWLLVFQFISVATAGPWCILLALPLASPSIKLSGSDLDFVRVLPLSIITGYILLLIAMALPSSGSRALVSSELQQIAVVAWNVFPIFVTLSQYIFQVLFRVSGYSADRNKSPLNERVSLSTLRVTYAFALLTALAAHIATLTTTLSTILFPSLFNPSTIGSLHPAAIFRLPTSHSPISSMGDGTLQFLQWDCLVGSATILIPTVVSYHNTQRLHGEQSGLATLSMKTLISTIIIGPGATLIGLRWRQDEMVGREETNTQVSKKK